MSDIPCVRCGIIGRRTPSTEPADGFCSRLCEDVYHERIRREREWRNEHTDADNNEFINREVADMPAPPLHPQ